MFAKTVARAAPTGLFTTAQMDGRWWLVDPNGYAMLSVGTDHCNYEVHWCEALHYAPYHRSVQKQYGSADRWGKAEAARLRSWGFTTLGANSSPQVRHRGLAHTILLDLGAEFASRSALIPRTGWTGFPDVFDPDFEQSCLDRARVACLPNVGDPWLVGYYLDNELEWWGKHDHPWGLAEGAWELPADAAGKRALVSALGTEYCDDLALLNGDFGTGFRSWQAVESSTTFMPPLTPRAEHALMAFVRNAADRYFDVTTTAVRTWDPRHLVMGCRFAGHAPDPAYVAAGRTCDVITVNTYPPADLVAGRIVGLADTWPARYELTHKPWIVTEWSFPALDARDSRGKPLPSAHGAGMRVDTQAQRARAYALMQRELFGFPFVIGSHYFMWVDEPATGISKDFPEDSNYGLVSESDEPYAALTASAAAVNPLLPAFHAGRREELPTPQLDVPRTRPASLSRAALTWTVTGRSFTIDNGLLRLVKEDAGGALIDRVQMRDAQSSGGWADVGTFATVLAQVVDGKDRWPRAGRVERVEVRAATERRIVLDVTVAKDADPWAGEEAFRCAWRIAVTPGVPYVLARALWFENSGARPWGWNSYFAYALAAFRTPEVAPVPHEYWLSCGAWRDPAANRFFGVLPLGHDERQYVSYWLDGAEQHPDCLRYEQGSLKPGERVEPKEPEPTVAVFALQGSKADPQPWRALAWSLAAQSPLAALE